MPPMKQINVRSSKKKTMTIKLTSSDAVQTADWAVRNASVHIISSAEKDVKVSRGSHVDLRKANRALRGKSDYAEVQTTILRSMETT